MNPPAEEPWVLTDDIWRGWAHKSRARAQRAARKRNLFVGMVLAGGLLGSVLLRFMWS